MIKICTATFDNLRLARLWNRAIKATCTDEHETEIYYADNPPLVADFETPWSDCRIPNSGRPAVAACYRAMPQEGQRIFIEEDIIPLRKWSIDDYPGDPGILCGIKRGPWFAFAVYRTGFATALTKGYTPIYQQHAREMQKPDWIGCDLWSVIVEADAKIVGDHFVHVDRIGGFHQPNIAKQLLIDALDVYYTEASQERSRRPSLARRAANYTAATVRHTIAGKPKADQETVAERWKICLQCPDDKYEVLKQAAIPKRLLHLPIVGTCTDSTCGCYLHGEANERDKLSLADQKCPRGHWGQSPTRLPASAVSPA